MPIHAEILLQKSAGRVLLKRPHDCIVSLSLGIFSIRLDKPLHSLLVNRSNVKTGVEQKLGKVGFETDDAGTRLCRRAAS